MTTKTSNFTRLTVVRLMIEFVLLLILCMPTGLAQDKVAENIEPARESPPPIINRVPDSEPKKKEEQKEKENNSPKPIMFNISAYTISDQDMNGAGITATGTKARSVNTSAPSTIAVDPSIIPYGTILYIPYFKDYPNEGLFRAEDTGSAIRGYKLDVCFSSLEKALKFGRRNLEVYIVE